MPKESKKKPAPKWGYAGHLDITPFQFEPHEIKVILRKTGLPRSDNPITRHFLSDLEEQVSLFRAHERYETELPKRGEILAALNVLNRYVDPLSKRLHDLDARTRYLLGLNLPSIPDERDGFRSGKFGDYVDHVGQSLANLQVAIDKTERDTKLLPSKKGGAPEKYARLRFAINVAHLFAKYLSKQPTASQEGPYYTILEVGLSAANTGDPIKGVYDLADNALKAARMEIPPKK